MNEMIKNGIAICSSIAGYDLAKKAFRIYGYPYGQNNIVVKVGATAASVCFGLWVGNKVRNKTEEIEKGLKSLDAKKKEEIKEEVQKQAADFQDWMNSVQ